MESKLLKETVELVAASEGGFRKLGLRFYERLFEKYPQVKHFFKTPPEEQHKKLMASIGAIVAGVNENNPKLSAYLQAMGIRHAKFYGTVPDHYPAVAENLLAVLAEHLGADWTPAHAEAWAAALNHVAGVMIEAANNPEKYTDALAAGGYEPDGTRRDSNQPWLLEAVASAK